MSESPLPFIEDKINKFYEITPQSVFDQFILQYSQRKDIIDVLSQKKYLDVISNDADNIDQQVLSTAKNFDISGTNERQIYKINFQWPNAYQISDLANLTIDKTLFSVKKTILEDLKFIKSYIESKNQRLSDKLNYDLDLLEISVKDEINSKLIFLKEQSIIAKNLGLKDNTLYGRSLYTTQLQTDDINFKTTAMPYFLVGYEAIEQEIQNLENRSLSDRLFLSEDYLPLMKKLRAIENDLTPSQIENAITLFSEEIPTDWINFNIAFADISSNNNRNLIFILSALLGLFVGTFFVLIVNTIRKTYSQS